MFTRRDDGRLWVEAACHAPLAGGADRCAALVASAAALPTDRWVLVQVAVDAGLGAEDSGAQVGRSLSLRLSAAVDGAPEQRGRLRQRLRPGAALPQV